MLDNQTFTAVPVSERLPQHSMVYHIYVGGKIPMLAMLYPTGVWKTMGMSASTEIKGVTHWLEIEQVEAEVLSVNDRITFGVEEAKKMMRERLMIPKERFGKHDENPKHSNKDIDVTPIEPNFNIVGKVSGAVVLDRSYMCSNTIIDITRGYSLDSLELKAKMANANDIKSVICFLENSIPCFKNRYYGNIKEKVG